MSPPPAVPPYKSIGSADALQQFCDRMLSSKCVTFDTEFVSEDTYRPELCLIQAAADGEIVIIDPLEVDVQPFWEALVKGDFQTVVHAGREELRFCMFATGAKPKDLFDLQIAAGLVGLEYPAAYSTLVSRLMGQNIPKGETRTNWRQRPLTKGQIDYAVLDVVYLEPMRDNLADQLEAKGRLPWLSDEIQSWQQKIEQYEYGERWRRVSGVNSLNPASLAVVRELWKWREQQAADRDQPVRRIIRDDLMVEISRRKLTQPKQIANIRGMERSGLKRHVDTLAELVQKALDLPEEELPKRMRGNNLPQTSALTTFMNAALNSICKRKSVAASIVGTTEDLKEFIAASLELDGYEKLDPSLMKGWRAEIIGKSLHDILTGKLALIVADPASDTPLDFVELGGNKSSDVD